MGCGSRFSQTSLAALQFFFATAVYNPNITTVLNPDCCFAHTEVDCNKHQEQGICTKCQLHLSSHCTNLCPGSTGRIINVLECRAAADILDFSWGGTHKWDNYPSGCHTKYDKINKEMVVVLSTASNGFSKHPRAKVLCKSPGSVITTTACDASMSARSNLVQGSTSNQSVSTNGSRSSSACRGSVSGGISKAPVTNFAVASIYVCFMLTAILD